MTPNRRSTSFRETSESSKSLISQIESFKLPAGLLNLSLIQANGGYPPTAPNQAAFSRNQRSGSFREDITRRRPRLTYSRWNMMISSRYKTELCRQYEEEGICQFEDKCLFAHGKNEIRPLPRHPKYKTELCRDFHETGFCSFGPRCNFIHSSTDDASMRSVTSSSQSKPEQMSYSYHPRDSFSNCFNKLIEGPMTSLNVNAPEFRSVSPPFEGILGDYVTNGQFGAIGENSNDTVETKSPSPLKDLEIDEKLPVFQHLGLF